MYDKNSSGSIAKDRLKYLILKDRVACTGETLDMIKQDVIKSISNYIDIDKYSTRLTLEQGASGESSITYISIKAPIK